MEDLRPKNLIRLSKSSLSYLEKQSVMRVLDKEFLGMGDEVHQFERMLSEFFGRPAICVANGTTALQLAIQSCDIGPGDEVLVPSLTSFQAISANGAIPVACDINEMNLGISLVDAEKRLTNKTKAIMPVHFAGDASGLDDIYAFAKKHRLRVIEDAAHAFGHLTNHGRVGSNGDIACFSFDGIKNITSGEGGCIVASDENVLERLKDMRLLGVKKDTDMRYGGSRSWEFDVVEQGWRYHMSNIMAAIGIEQLKRFEVFKLQRQMLVNKYDQLLGAVPGIHLYKRNYDYVVPHIYVIRIPGMINRAVLREYLLKEGIQTGIHYQPNHTLSLYKNTRQDKFEVIDRVYPELLTLPLHVDLSEADVDYISRKINKALSDRQIAFT